MLAKAGGHPTLLTHGEGHAGQGGKGGLVQRGGQEHELDQLAQVGLEEGVLLGAGLGKEWAV